MNNAHLMDSKSIFVSVLKSMKERPRSPKMQDLFVAEYERSFLRAATNLEIRNSAIISEKDLTEQREIESMGTGNYMLYLIGGSGSRTYFISQLHVLEKGTQHNYFRQAPGECRVVTQYNTNVLFDDIHYLLTYSLLINFVTSTMNLDRIIVAEIFFNDFEAEALLAIGFYREIYNSEEDHFNLCLDIGTGSKSKTATKSSAFK